MGDSSSSSSPNKSAAQKWSFLDHVHNHVWFIDFILSTIQQHKKKFVYCFVIVFGRK